MFLANLTLRQGYLLLLLGIGLLGLLHSLDLVLGRPFWPVTRALFLGSENNVPTWYSSTVFLFASMLSFACYRECALRGIHPNIGWLILAGVLAGMSCDEVASLHEYFGRYLSKVIAPESTARWRHSRWTIAVAPILLILAMGLGWCLSFHLSRAKRTGVFLLVGAFMVFGSGVLLEMSINWLDHDELQWLWEIEIIVEEVGEMFGGWLMGFGLLLLLEQLRGSQDSRDDRQQAT